MNTRASQPSPATGSGAWCSKVGSTCRSPSGSASQSWAPCRVVVLGGGVLAVADAAPGRHQVELAGPDRRVVPGGVPVLDLAGEQPAHRLQPGVRVRRDDHALAGPVDLVGTVVVQEAPGTDQGALPLRERTSHGHRAEPAERHVTRGQDLHDPSLPRTPRWQPSATRFGSAAATAAEVGRAVAAARGASEPEPPRRLLRTTAADRDWPCGTAATAAGRRPGGRPPRATTTTAATAATAGSAGRAGRRRVRRRPARARRERAACSRAWPGPETRVVVGWILAARVSVRTSLTCWSVISVMTVPAAPARAVRPERCR